MVVLLAAAAKPSLGLCSGVVDEGAVEHGQREAGSMQTEHAFVTVLLETALPLQADSMFGLSRAPKQSIRSEGEIDGALLDASNTTSMTRLSGIYRHATSGGRRRCRPNAAAPVCGISMEGVETFPRLLPQRLFFGPCGGSTSRGSCRIADSKSRGGSSWPGGQVKGSS
jgi:hypothetical protein